MSTQLNQIVKSNKSVTIINISLSLLYEVVIVINGLIVPRLILGTFGSATNGLVSSITQFLNIITILEGGVGGVVKAALYKPLASNDNKKLSAVYNAAKSFYQKLAVIYLSFGLALCIIYPLIFKTDFDWYFVSALILVIAIQTFVQYFFSLNYRVLIIADRKGFIVSIVSIITQLVTLALSVLIIKIYPNILLFKGISVLLYVLQPLVYGAYVRKHYSINKNEPKDQESLKQRWDGFSHNFAYFIHSNTDVVLITVFCSFLDVSVYSTYFMVVFALRSLVASISTSIAPTMGNILAKGNDYEKNEAFDIYSFVANFISTISFTCGVILVTPFVMLYTENITDANYYHPWLGYLLMLAEYIYCIRGPYVETVYSSGHFKQTAKYAYIEAGLNIILSVILIQFLGVEGVAIGTLVAMAFRWIVHIWYLKKNILNRPVISSIKSFGACFLSMGITILVSFFIPFAINSYLSWFLFAIIVGATSALSLLLLELLMDRKTIKIIIGKLFKRGL